MNLGVTELIIILVIVIILFGAGRISGIGRELGEAIGNFRSGVESASDDDTATNDEA